MPSEVIARYLYDGAAQTLFIRFVSGTHYAYFGVPQALFDEFVTATSKGRFFGQRIRSQFRFKRLAT